MKQYDPLLRKCECGYTWHFNRLHYMLMILLGRYIVTCPQCHRKHYYKLVYHSVEEHSKTRNQNNELLNCKQEVWKNS